MHSNTQTFTKLFISITFIFWGHLKTQAQKLPSVFKVSPVFIESTDIYLIENFGLDSYIDLYLIKRKGDLDKVWTFDQAQFPDKEVETIEVYFRAASAYNFMQYDSAIVYLEKTIQLCDEIEKQDMLSRKKGIDINRPEFKKLSAWSTRWIGKCYYKLAAYAQSLSCFNEALDQSLHAFGESTLIVAEMYKEIGRAHAAKGDLESALKHTSKTLSILGTISGNSDGVYADILARVLEFECVLALGEVHVLRGEHDKALVLLNLAKEFYTSNLGEDDFRLIDIYYWIGKSNTAQGKYEDAKKILERAQQILVKKSFDRSELMAKIYLGLGSLNEKAYSREKALKYYQNSHEILSQLLPPKHPQVESILAKIVAIQ